MFKNIVMILFGIFLLVIALALFQAPQEAANAAHGGNISIHSISRIGDYAYVLLSAGGNGNVTLLTYSERPVNEIFVLNDRGIGMTRFNEFVTSVRSLEQRGFALKLSGSTATVNRGVYIIPTGAMPFYVLDSLKDTDAIIFYIGKKDLVLEGGNIKSRNWYSELSEEEKGRIIIYEKTLDEFLESKTDILTPILENSWHLKNRKRFLVTTTNRTTLSISSANTSDNAYVRVFYDFGKNATGILDSGPLPRQTFALATELDIFPDEKFKFEANLNKTNGTAFVVIEKDGIVLSRIREKRIIDQGVIYERFQFREPGDYVIKIEDNEGTVGGTIAHVKNVVIALKEKRARTFVFSVMIDNQPVNGADTSISLNGGAAKVYTISDGELSVTARLNKGHNKISFQIFGSEYSTSIENTYEEIGEVYIKYGIPGFVLVIIIYAFARLSRKPVYVLRISNIARDIRKELRLQPGQAIEFFKLARRELGLKGPLTAQEFSFILKRHFTEGADITEGNIEEVLKKLANQGLVQHMRGYYQLRGDGKLVKNVMERIIREKLIERGTSFMFENDVFQTAHYKIAFLGDSQPDKAIIVYDNEDEFKKWLNALTEKERAANRIRQFNGSLSFIPIDKIDDVL